MRLAPRTLLYFGLLVSISTGALGWFLREDRRASETARFADEVRDACQRVAADIASQAESTPGRVKVNVDLQPRKGWLSEVNVIGCTVDEALTRAGRFLDETMFTDQRSVRVVHGYGTGQLRRAIAGFLKHHPLVAHFEEAPPGQGGGGVTVVELKE